MKDRKKFKVQKICILVTRYDFIKHPLGKELSLNITKTIIELKKKRL